MNCPYCFNRRSGKQKNDTKRGHRNRVFCNNIWLKCIDSLKTRFLWRSGQILLNQELEMFQSPIGEVVKETPNSEVINTSILNVSIPDRGSGKGDKVV